MQARWAVWGLLVLSGCEATDDAADAATGGTTADAATGGTTTDAAAGGTTTDAAVGGTTTDAAAGGTIPDAATGGTIPDAATGGTTPDAAVPVDDLPLGDCDPGRGLACEGALVCTAAPLSDLSACPVTPTYYDLPGCGPMPHPDGAGEITPTCCTDAECTDAGRAGRCVYTENQTGCCGTQGETHCAYDACQTDADCPADRICLTTGMRGAEASTCVRAACRADADCGAVPGAECRLLGSGIFAALTCVAPDAECRVDADCRADCPSAICEAVWAVVGGDWTLQTGSACDITSCLAVP